MNNQKAKNMMKTIEIKHGKAFHGELVAFRDGNDLIVANTGSSSFWAVRCPEMATVFPKLEENQFWDYQALGFKEFRLYPQLSWDELDALLYPRNNQ